MAGNFLRATALAIGLFATAAAAADGPRIVVSIQPLHGLVAGVAGEHAEAHLLMRGGQSPHVYSLSPSDARALHRADAIFAAGDTVEGFLHRPLRGIGEETHVVWMMALEDAHLLDTRTGGEWPHHHGNGDHDHDDHGHGHDDGGHGHDDHGHGHGDGKHGHDDHGHGHGDGEHGHDDHGHGHGDGEHGHDDHGHDHDHADGGHGHAHGEIDGHLWLSPGNAIAFTRAVAETLARIDPDNRSSYEANARAQIDRIRALDETLAERLQALQGIPYFVFHDAYQYFEDRYGLAAVGSITVDPDRPPGARRLSELRERVRNEEVHCIFAEPQFEPRVVTAIEQETGVRTGVLDPLGVDIAPGPDAWFRLMEGLAEGLESCLQT